GGPRAKDPGRLSEKQPHQYFGCGIFHARTRRGAGFNADSVGGVDGCAEAIRLDGADRRAEAIVASGGPVERLLDQQAAFAGAGREGHDAGGRLARQPIFRPMKKGPSRSRYSDVCCVFRIACTRAESGYRSLPINPITKSLSSRSRPWHASRISCAKSAAPNVIP